ncbi:copper amine oxidase N-terminal domain-containing protein [Paenibacillus sp. PL2-23]|uniref:copper amine oxidase N-terminal domain-containing protein n=1 Tax=Paenibacillus sp. PL2-23 TaxID=2100729 RepID=UPI0030F9DCEC
MTNKMGKTLLSTLSVAVLSISTGAAVFANGGGTDPVSIKPIMANVEQEQTEQEQASHYMSVTGIIKAIEPYGLNEDMEMVTLEAEDGSITNLIMSEQTYLLDELAVGSSIIAFYDASLPVIMIYPPQYTAVAIALADDKRNVKVDSFDENLVSADGSLKLNLSEETTILQTDGTAYEGELAGRDLVVVYGPVTRSIPAQTTPEQVTVLPVKDEPEQGVSAEEDVIITDLGNVEEKLLLINGQAITAPSAYLHENGTVMVPLRAAAEALGYELTWEAETRTVRVGPVISLQIGEDEYLYAKMAPFRLGTAPVLSGGVTYVPVSFFKTVLRAEAVSVDAEHISIQE